MHFFELERPLIKYLKILVLGSENMFHSGMQIHEINLNLKISTELLLHFDELTRATILNARCFSQIKWTGNYGEL